MNVLDLFSGIGGFSLGLERAGMETVAFCEIDPFCNQVLKEHWGEVRNLGDLRGLPVSGLECCGFSNWIERRTEQVSLRPDWIILENVYHTWRKWVPELRSELYQRGYSSLPIQMSAAEFGAPHNRKRVFIIAHADSDTLRELSWWWQWEGRQVAAELGQYWNNPCPEGMDDGVSRRLDRNKALGNAVVPQIPELIGRAILAA